MGHRQRDCQPKLRCCGVEGARRPVGDRPLAAKRIDGEGEVFNKPGAGEFHAALVKAGFYTQWRTTYGSKAWEKLEQYTGKLT